MQVDVVNGPTVHGAAVVNVKGLLAGVEATYNTQLDEKDQVSTGHCRICSVERLWESCATEAGVPGLQLRRRAGGEGVGDLAAQL
jgi:hypothetical protein